ncbi:hypothetical protein ACFC1T_16980 [Kitasatospora sp. NPDC056076]|uniref:hypothetical protein n=1 Tax=Kitasatospora sp. NPDC056076 TaxID=3345703 RepID=UPI0035D7112F
MKLNQLIAKIRAAKRILGHGPRGARWLAYGKDAAVLTHALIGIAVFLRHW